MSESASRDFVPHGDALQIRPPTVHPATPCAACSAPVERVYSTRWCACQMCFACVRGIVYSCPVCRAHPPSTADQDVDMSAAHPVREADLSAWRWLAWIVLIIAMLSAAAWLAS